MRIQVTRAVTHRQSSSVRMNGLRPPRYGSAITLKRSTGGKTALIFTNHSFHFDGGAGAFGTAVWESNHTLEPRTLLRSVCTAIPAARASHCMRAAEFSQAWDVPSLAKR